LKLQIFSQDKSTFSESFVGWNFELDSDPFTVVKEVGAEIGYPLNSTAIANCHFIKGKSNKIVVEFFCKESQRNFIQAGKEARRSGFSKVFINQQLTWYKRRLLYNCKEFAKYNCYKFAWACYSTIFLKKDENSLPLKIESDFDLVKLESDIVLRNEALLSKCPGPSNKA
jgi:hypothetical protein